MIDPRLAILALPLLDRLGGWKFKPARRYGIPLFVYLISPSTEMAVLCIVMAAIFTFNLDEIEGYQDNASGDVAIGWEEVFLHGLGIGMCLYPLAGLTSLFVPLAWVVGVYLSNKGIGDFRLKWRYTEALRGLTMGLAIAYPIL